MNDYDKMSDDYIKTHDKPDKRHSMLPTMLHIFGSLKNKTVLDVGCGDGFFTTAYARDAQNVYGIDNSFKQIQKAAKNNQKNIHYALADMMSYDYPSVDYISSPFVLNYLSSLTDIEVLFKLFFDALNDGGKLVSILDMPQHTVHDMKRFGAIKKVPKLEEGVAMDVELYDKNEHLLTLHSYYHTKQHIEDLLKKVGFTQVTWHTPIISDEGINILGKEFWEGYIENVDVAYFSAEK